MVAGLLLPGGNTGRVLKRNGLTVESPQSGPVSRNCSASVLSSLRASMLPGIGGPLRASFQAPSVALVTLEQAPQTGRVRLLSWPW